MEGNQEQHPKVFRREDSTHHCRVTVGQGSIQNPKEPFGVNDIITTHAEGLWLCGYDAGKSWAASVCCEEEGG